jgi:hypothetical protein
LLGVVPALAVVPLNSIAGTLLGATPAGAATLGTLPALLALGPFAFALLSLGIAARRGVRRVPTWTCGSPVGPHAQYSATAFAKPLRTIFAFVLVPERERRTEGGPSPWFPQRIVYRTESRYLVDEAARRLAALTFRLARRSRAVQSGHLRLYLAYELVAVLALAAAAR